MRHGLCVVLLAGATPYREFDVQNRMKGTAGYFTAPASLALDSSSQAAPIKLIKAKFWQRDAEP
jgi:hypothetical protein